MENTAAIIIPFDSPTFLEIFEMEAIPIIRKKYEFTYEKEIRDDETLVIIKSHSANERTLALHIGEVFVELLKGVKTGKAKKPTREDHIRIHKDLHRAFDELLGDYLNHHPHALLSNITAQDLMEWSCKQTIDPDEGK